MLEYEQLHCHEILCGTLRCMCLFSLLHFTQSGVSAMLELTLHWDYLFTLSYALDFITYPILYYFILLMTGCGTCTPIYIDHLDIRPIGEVEDTSFIGIYLSLRKYKTPMYKLILNYAHMNATCSSRGWHATITPESPNGSYPLCTLSKPYLPPSRLCFRPCFA